jgi:hypothetical protein
MMIYVEQQLHAVQATTRFVFVQQQHLADSSATHSLIAGVPSCNNNRYWTEGLLYSTRTCSKSYCLLSAPVASSLSCCCTTAKPLVPRC